MSGMSLHTMGQQHGRRSWAEPWKIKMVEPLKMTTREERVAALEEAGYNTFLLRSDDVYIDLLTDSGTSAMSDRQWAGMMLGDEAYAGSRNFYHLEAAVQRFYGYTHILPTHQGRGAEHLISQTLIKAGDHIGGNMYFTTTRLHQELAGATFHDVIIDEAHDPQDLHPFKGNVDLAKVQALDRPVRRGPDPVHQPRRDGEHGRRPAGLDGERARAQGAPRPPRHQADARRHPHGRERAVHPGARGGLRRQVDRRDRARVLLPHRRRVDVRQEGQPRQHRRLAGRQRLRRLRGAAQPRRGLRGAPHVRRPRRARHGGARDRHRGVGVRTSTSGPAWARCATWASCSQQWDIPIVEPVGGHAIFLDARRFYPHLVQDQFPAQTLAAELYLDSGIRSMERGIASAGRNAETGDHNRPKLELTRLTIPRRVYTQAHMDVVAESVKACYDARDQARGLEMVYEPRYLRFFQARFTPL